MRIAISFPHVAWRKEDHGTFFRECEADGEAKTVLPWGQPRTVMEYGGTAVCLVLVVRCQARFGRRRNSTSRWIGAKLGAPSCHAEKLGPLCLAVGSYRRVAGMMDGLACLKETGLEAEEMRSSNPLGTLFRWFPLGLGCETEKGDSCEWHIQYLWNTNE